MLTNNIIIIISITTKQRSHRVLYIEGIALQRERRRMRRASSGAVEDNITENYTVHRRAQIPVSGAARDRSIRPVLQICRQTARSLNFFSYYRVYQNRNRTSVVCIIVLSTPIVIIVCEGMIFTEAHRSLFFAAAVAPRKQCGAHARAAIAFPDATASAPSIYLRRHETRGVYNKYDIAM